ncbi:SDR family NAD(P)-dependent oxidoreductase [Kushneria marisflavi]|uniref:3-oxoacyl-ACP reductase n=1 Tax=Kushneria marisflavi TaxID=157779 RepID=A0A240UPC7_9GAMM|nr:SDR family oxidoreductase [Kushneria marisflavi]ART63344.1 3-oxoacyl-ACP reductase [Kushneria marisflavi]RKD84386.1 D-xylose dehydrogenase [Kushneria marisflavi]
MTAPIYPDLKGRRVVVTGGGSGIGEGIVRAFAEQGSEVHFLDIIDEAAALAESLGEHVHFHRCDLTDPRALDQVLADIGTVEVLVNNAANDDRHRLEDVTPEYWDDRMAINLRHQALSVRAVAAGMRAQGRGSIINMGSISWHLGQPGMVLYETAKAAIEGLTRALASELGSDGIRVNCVIPGNIKTPRQSRWYTPEDEAQIVAEQKLKVRLHPHHVASMVLFLASDAAGGCTAHNYWVDGGWL